RKPRLSVCQTQSFAATRFEKSFTIDAGAVIFYFNPHHAIAWRRRYLNPTRSRVADRMAHRVLDNWLEDQVRNAHVQHFGIDVDVSGESILKTNPLDFEIAV